MIKKLFDLLTRTKEVLLEIEGILQKEKKIKSSQVVTPYQMDKWLLAGDKSWRYRFNYGAYDLGSPWRSEIPVTPLLLAGLEKKKVKIYAEYSWNELVGGFSLYVEKLEHVTQEDVDSTIISRDEFEEHERAKYD